jgi:DNA mismatch repair protein MutS
VTGAGARQLAEDLAAPLLDRAAIEARLDLVQWLHEDALLREDLRSGLRACPMWAARWAAWWPGAAPRAIWGNCAMGLAARRLAALLGSRAARPPLMEALLPALTGHEALVDLFARALVATPPPNGRRAASSRTAMMPISITCAPSRKTRARPLPTETKYRNQTGIAALKIKHNGVLGYFIEVPARHGDQLMTPDSGFTHRQTMAGAMRFNALALHEEAGRIAEAGGQEREDAHFQELTATAIAARNAIAATAAALARIDVAAGQAERASEGQWCRPALPSARNWRSAAGGTRWWKPRWRQGRTLWPMPATSRLLTGCGWWAGRTWAVNPPFCGRMR